jgi:hypothetical protein
MKPYIGRVISCVATRVNDSLASESLGFGPICQLKLVYFATV